DGQAIQPPREGDGEVLVGGGCRSDPPAPGGLPERDRAARTVLERSTSQRNRAKTLSPVRVTPWGYIPGRAPLLGQRRGPEQAAAAPGARDGRGSRWRAVSGTVVPKNASAPAAIVARTANPASKPAATTTNPVSRLLSDTLVPVVIVPIATAATKESG